MVYAGIFAHGISMSAAETARTMPLLSAGSVRQAMRWAGDERRLADASAAVLGYLRRRAISATWGRSERIDAPRWRYLDGGPAARGTFPQALDQPSSRRTRRPSGLVDGKHG